MREEILKAEFHPKDPKPGSYPAKIQGCRCKETQNNYGMGIIAVKRKVWVVSNLCPIHGEEQQP